ncbi:hypothetical protein GM418_00475 [Maribellus comscasis]|uniref:Glycine zipper-like domain-containing protein n=1 Tax=Maribellus comscasis TaxID=2681766 RepID=A0A6I6JIT5_9BACT|nr:hypothetical protein [Maribellus comscasis]QGY42181.1 hypothetical protein GM418_00475 [Maribellus comscasis]
MDQSYLFVGLAVVAFLLLFLIIILIKQNRADVSEPVFQNRRKNRAGRKNMASGIAVGLGIGVAIGVAMDNIAIGIAIGVAVGSSLGLSFETAARKKEAKSRFGRNQSVTHSESSGNKILLILMALILGILFLGLMLFFKSK